MLSISSFRTHKMVEYAGRFLVLKTDVWMYLSSIHDGYCVLRKTMLRFLMYVECWWDCYAQFLILGFWNLEFMKVMKFIPCLFMPLNLYRIHEYAGLCLFRCCVNHSYAMLGCCFWECWVWLDFEVVTVVSINPNIFPKNSVSHMHECVWFIAVWMCMNIIVSLLCCLPWWNFSWW